MEELKIGLFIRDRRLELGLTQQQLAEKLNITDKAVSKWERAVSYPDITILRELAAALEVSVAELLAGERDPRPAQPPAAVEDMVVETVSYAETARRKNGGWRFWAFAALTSACLVAVLVCLIIFFAVPSARRAMLIAIRSIAFGWAVCYPLLRVERYPVRRSLTILSLALLPYLASLHPVLMEKRFLAVELLSLLFLWGAYFISVRYRQQRLLATGWILLLGGLLSMAITLMVSGQFSHFISGITLASSGGGLLLGCAWQPWLRFSRPTK